MESQERAEKAVQEEAAAFLRESKVCLSPRHVPGQSHSFASHTDHCTGRCTTRQGVFTMMKKIGSNVCSVSSAETVGV